MKLKGYMIETVLWLFAYDNNSWKKIIDYRVYLNFLEQTKFLVNSKWTSTGKHDMEGKKLKETLKFVNKWIS